jgi:hypothetical protein
MATATGHSLHRTLWENFRTNKSTNSGINPVVVNKHAKIGQVVSEEFFEISANQNT